MYRIGLNVASHDTSCCLFKNDKLIVAIEEERLSHKKHTKDFPFKSIQKCIEFEKININDIDTICIGWDIPLIIKNRYLRNIITNNNSKFLEDKKNEMKSVLSIDKNIKKIGFKGKIEYFNHYDCHTAYAFATSKFNQAIYISLDGYGEDNSGKIGFINSKNIKDFITYPIKHSLGLLYAGITDFLGFKRLCDEGIVMGLAAYGNFRAKINKTNLSYYKFFKKNIKLINGNITINESFFLLGLEKRGFFTNKFFKLFGQKRRFDEDISKHHQNIAAGFQKRIEEIIYGLAKFLNNKI
jgi:carbamoyltransferase